MPTLATMRPSRRWGTQICCGSDLGHPRHPPFDFSLTSRALQRRFAVLPYRALQIFAYRRQEISMRMMMFVSFPVEPFNAAVRDGSAGAKTKKILDQLKPEAAYFMADRNGRRCGVLIVDMAETSQIPSLAEPWFLTFNAAGEFFPVMLPQDLAAAGLGGVGKQGGLS